MNPHAAMPPFEPRELTGPTHERERIETLDVLRGLAILGILVVNIQVFAMPEAAYMDPAAYGDLTGANFLVWLGTHVLARQKFITLFSMLFGVGVLLMSQRRDRADLPAAGLHYRRMAWLLIIGLAHAYLLWYGDILVTYALLGMVVFWLRHLPPGWLATIGAVMYAVPSVAFLLLGTTLVLRDPPDNEMFQLSLMSVQQELAVYRGNWIEQMAHRAPRSFHLQSGVLLTYTGWFTGGLMLVGMALFKTGLLRGTAARSVYVALIVAALLIGLPMIGLGVVYRFAEPWTPLSFFLGHQLNYWAAPLVTLGWASAAILLVRVGALHMLTHAMGAVGRMALTNYLAQSVICTFIFYGHGLGLFGHLERLEQLGMVVVIWLAQLIWSPLWLRHYDYGPIEWLWRALTYRQLRP